MNTSFLSLWSRAPYRVGAMLVAGSLVLTGCQTTSSMQAGQTNLTAADAKARVNAAIKAQYRQATAYHSNIELNNRATFTNVDLKKIRAHSAIDYCETTHDAAYIKLLKQAEAAGLDIDDARYDDQRTRLEQTYVACDKNFRAWYQNKEQSYYSEYYEEEDMPEVQAVTPYYQALFDRYDDDNEDNAELLSKEDINRAKLMDEHWYKPLSINVQGVYQPLAGKLTVLPSAQYDTRNHHTSLNQPIYFDAKSGNLYLWADNFAMLNSKLLDKKLGTQWQNKWLKLSLNDGSLPKGFGRTLITAHLQASETVHADANKDRFSTMSAATLAKLTPKIPAHQLSAMMQSDHIIAQTLSVNDYRQEGQMMSEVLFQRLQTAYPELVAEALAETESDDYSELSEVDSDAEASTVEAAIADYEYDDSDDYDSDYSNYDDAYSDDYEEKTLAQTVKEKLDSKHFAYALIRMIDDSRTSEIKEASAALKVQRLYGFDKQGNLLWTHVQMPIAAFVNKDLDERSAVADIFTTYSRIDRSQKDFPNLPDNVQTPNAQNSVDIKAYIEQFGENSDETADDVSMRVLSMMMMASAMRR